jgi:hypothetical protein
MNMTLAPKYRNKAMRIFADMRGGRIAHTGGM